MSWYNEFRPEWKQIIETVAKETDDFIYRNIEISESQIQNGQVKDARSSLSEKVWGIEPVETECKVNFWDNSKTTNRNYKKHPYRE